MVNIVTYIEIGQDILPLDIFSPQTDLSVGMVLILLKVSQGYIKDTMFQSFRGNLIGKR